MARDGTVVAESAPRSEEPAGGLVAGIDGMRGGWIVAFWRGPGTAVRLASSETLAGVAGLPGWGDVVSATVDIPIGLPDVALPGGRPADQEARRRLGAYHSRAFSSPARAVLGAGSFEEACAISRTTSPGAKGITQQCWHIAGKLREAEALITTGSPLLEVMVEAHPEVSFAAMNDGAAVAASKAKAAGRAARATLLARAGFVGLDDILRADRRHGAGRDDVLDACAAAWTAWRRLTGVAYSLPVADAPSQRFMRIWV